MGKTQWISLGATLLWVLCVRSAQAAEGPIEEIVVTAEKRATALQETPLAVTALTANDIKTGQIDDIQKVQYLVPNVVLNTLGGTTNLYIRGIGTDINDSLAEPGVALYVDGVYQGVTGDQSAIYNDLERIEVLRGPQGTLYGRNSTGGNVNIFTKQAGFEPGFEASLLVGEDERTKTAVAGQGTLIDGRLAARANLVVDESNGVRDNPVTGNTIDKRDLLSGAVSLLYTPTDDIELVLRGDQTKRNDDTPRWQYIEVVPGSGLNPLMFGGQPGSSDGKKINNDLKNKYDTDIWGVSATLDWDLSGASVKSITAYRVSDWNGPYDNDGTNVAFLNAIPTQTSKQFSQEIDLLGTAFGDRLEWITGVYYFTQDALAEYTYTLPVLQPLLEQAFGLPPGGLGDPTLNPFYAVRANGSGGSAIPFNDFHTRQDTESFAAFAQATYHLSDRTRVTGGARYTSDQKDITQSWTTNISPNGCVDLKQNGSWDDPTWKIGADHNFTDDVMAYASVSKGFHGGGFNGGSCGDEYDPETVIAYEVGLKTMFADDRAQLNLAGFYYDYDDYQARLFIGGSALIQNAAKATVQGAEVELLWRPIDGLEVSGTASWLDGEFDKFSSDDPMTPAPTLVDLEGNKLLRSPEFSYNAGVQYTFGMGEASLTARYEVAYKDSYYITIFNNNYAKFPSNTLQNARLVWSNGGNWEVQGFVENLTDEEYLEARVVTPSLGGVTGMWAMPRTWGMQVSYRWGA